MPRFVAALAVTLTVATCIGFNTARYPAVWEMVRPPAPGRLPRRSAAEGEGPAGGPSRTPPPVADRGVAIAAPVAARIARRPAIAAGPSVDDSDARAANGSAFAEAAATQSYEASPSGPDEGGTAAEPTAGLSGPETAEQPATATALVPVPDEASQSAISGESTAKPEASHPMDSRSSSPPQQNEAEHASPATSPGANGPIYRLPPPEEAEIPSQPPDSRPSTRQSVPIYPSTAR